MSEIARKMKLASIGIAGLLVANVAKADPPSASPATRATQAPASEKADAPSAIQQASRFATITTSFGLLYHTRKPREFSLDADGHVLMSVGTKSDNLDAAVMVGLTLRVPTPCIYKDLSLGLFWPTFVQTVSRSISGQVAPVGVGVGAYYQVAGESFSLHLGWLKTQETALSAQAAAADSAGLPVPGNIPLTRLVGASSYFLAAGISL
ncbi:MAG: hypothetical protein QM756_44690 [Polyangiaceae bacterium]